MAPTAMFVAIDGDLAGIIAVADPIKQTTSAALAALRAEGIRIVMLTGDNRSTAQAVAGKLGITEIEAEVLPEHKHAIVQRLRGEGRNVAMAGDGVNDAPALAAADVGIAMGTGTEVAMQSAGITLVKGDLAGIVRARHLSRATMRNIRQNLALAFVYNTLGIPLAARRALPGFRLALESDRRRRRDEPQLGLGHFERAAAAPDTALSPRGFPWSTGKRIGTTPTARKRKTR